MTQDFNEDDSAEYDHATHSDASNPGPFIASAVTLAELPHADLCCKVGQLMSMSCQSQAHRIQLGVCEHEEHMLKMDNALRAGEKAGLLLLFTYDDDFDADPLKTPLWQGETADDGDVGNCPAVHHEHNGDGPWIRLSKEGLAMVKRGWPECSWELVY